MNKKTVLSLSVGLAMGVAGGAANAFPGFTGANNLSINLGSVVLGDVSCTHDTVSLGGSCFSTALGPSSLGGSYFLMGAGGFGITFIPRSDILLSPMDESRRGCAARVDSVESAENGRRLSARQSLGKEKQDVQG